MRIGTVPIIVYVPTAGLDLSVLMVSYRYSLSSLLILYLSISLHYADMPMHYAEILKGYNNDTFLDEKNYIFLIFAQNIECGYMLKPPH